MIVKEIRKRFWGLFIVHIYSEQRTKETYKHFVTIYFLKEIWWLRIVDFTWRTGGGNEYPIRDYWG